MQSRSKNPEVVRSQISIYIRGIGPPFWLPFDVDQYYNKENSVSYSQVMQSTDNIQQTLRRDVSAQRQGLLSHYNKSACVVINDRSSFYVVIHYTGRSSQYSIDPHFIHSQHYHCHACSTMQKLALLYNKCSMLYHCFDVCQQSSQDSKQSALDPDVHAWPY